MEKSCKHCNSIFEIVSEDLEFYEKLSPVFSGKKYLIPTPTLCPDCRQQRRLTWRNERSLYKRKCDLSSKDIISLYSPDKPYKVYSQKAWWSDKWDALDYGMDFDFSKSFFEQFNELLLKVPRISLYGNNNENSDYSNDTTNNKNCYLVFASDFNEECYYGIFNNSKNSMDCFECSKITETYECFNCQNSHKLFYSIDCKSCNHSSFLINSENCEYCYLSHNLNNKKYYFLNKEYSRDEYFEKVKNTTFAEAKKIFEKVKENCIYKNLKITNSENCFGNYIKNSKDCTYCFDVSDGNNCKYVYFGSQKLSDCMDTVMASINASKCYEVQTCLENCHNIIACNFCNNIQNTYYCDSCINCSNCFLSVGLRNKSYCVLNKQYTKEEYVELVPKIIEAMMTPPQSPSVEGEARYEQGEWGEFFPSSISPFGYNETVAEEYFPLEKKDVIKKGFKWSDYDTPFPKVEKIIPAKKIPESIANIPDDILNWAIECEITKKPFSIIKQELEFYRKHNLPIPKRHPDQRHLDRMALRNPRKLYDRKCDKCGNDIKTTYSQDRSEIVYCEGCYNREIY